MRRFHRQFSVCQLMIAIAILAPGLALFAWAEENRRTAWHLHAASGAGRHVEHHRSREKEFRMRANRAGDSDQARAVIDSQQAAWHAAQAAYYDRLRTKHLDAASHPWEFLPPNPPPPP